MLNQIDEYQEDINERSRAMLMTSMNKAFVFKSDCSIFIDNLLLYAHVVCIKQTLNDVDVYVCPSCSS